MLLFYSISCALNFQTKIMGAQKNLLLESRDKSTHVLICNVSKAIQGSPEVSHHVKQYL